MVLYFKFIFLCIRFNLLELLCFFFLFSFLRNSIVRKRIWIRDVFFGKIQKMSIELQDSWYIVMLLNGFVMLKLDFWCFMSFNLMYDIFFNQILINYRKKLSGSELVKKKNGPIISHQNPKIINQSNKKHTWNWWWNRNFF